VRLKILLDTHTWLWALGDRGRFSRDGLARLESKTNRFYLSAASTWEIVIKVRLGRLRLPFEIGAYLHARVALTPATRLPVAHEHALQLAELPLHHRDPFDRVLVAQAQVEGLAIMTADPAFQAYSVPLVGL
jgi:PIN domain nuclease of toxin-antitoxin system